MGGIPQKHGLCWWGNLALFFFFFVFQSVLARKKITLSMAGLTGTCESIEIIASVCSHSSSSACHSWAGLKRYKSSLGSNGSLRTFPFYVNCAHIGYVNDCSGCIFKTRFLHFVYSWKYSLLKMLFFFFSCTPLLLIGIVPGNGRMLSLCGAVFWKPVFLSQQVAAAR